MDLNRHVVKPMTEETGARAALGMAVGTLAGAAIALPLRSVSAPAHPEVDRAPQPRTRMVTGFEDAPL